MIGATHLKIDSTYNDFVNIKILKKLKSQHDINIT